MRQQLALLTAIAILGGCGRSSEGIGRNNSTVAPAQWADYPRSNRADVPGQRGNYPTADQTAGADRMDARAFSRTRIPCTDERTIATALFAILKPQMDPASAPQLVDYGVDDIALRDGPGRIAVIVVAFTPGDAGVVSTTANYYLLDRNCRVQTWRTVGP